jgi:hypothetical protein
MHIMDDALHDAADPMEGMENIPVALSFNVSRSYSASWVALCCLVFFSFINGLPYARFAVSGIPFIEALGGKGILGNGILLIAASCAFSFVAVRRTVTLFPDFVAFPWSGAQGNSPLSGIRQIRIVKDWRGEIDYVEVSTGGKKGFVVFGLQNMEAFTETLVNAAVAANPSVDVQHNRRPGMVAIACGCIISILVPFHYLWTAGAGMSHALPLLPLWPALLMMGIETACMGTCLVRLSGRLRVSYVCLFGLMLQYQAVLIWNIFFTGFGLSDCC